MNTWQRLNPHGHDPILSAVADYLADPATQAEMERLHATHTYPRAVLERLRG